MAKNHKLNKHVKDYIMKKFFTPISSSSLWCLSPWGFNNMVLQYFSFALICRYFIRKESCEFIHCCINNIWVTPWDPFFCWCKYQLQHRLIWVVILLHNKTCLLLNKNNRANYTGGFDMFSGTGARIKMWTWTNYTV